MRVRFRGVRGSVPWATAASIGHGCNTPCLEIVDESSDRHLILDAGSGIVGAGEALNGVTDIPHRPDALSLGSRPGLPFFAPLFRRGAAVTVWAPSLGRQFARYRNDVRIAVLSVPYDHLPSRPAIRMKTVGERGNQRIQVSGASAESSGQRFRISNWRHERRSRVHDHHEFGNADIDLALAHFSRGARVLIVDSHFTPEEIPAHEGWGHSDWSRCARFAAELRRAAARAVSSQTRQESDDDVTNMAPPQALFKNTWAAKEGEEFEV